MNYINPPIESPVNVIHKTFYSKIYNHEIGYNVYLPPDFQANSKKYPIAYHLHGWTGNESSEIWTMEKIYRGRQAVTVFPNSSPVIEDSESLPVETMLIKELIPHIADEYKVDTQQECMSISGFSMGGAFAFYLAVKYPELFSSVTAYAGTYHHFYHKGSQTVGVAPEKAVELYEDMMSEKRYLEAGNILYLVKQNIEMIRNKLKISLHVGASDVLFCDNEIIHLYLDSLDIAHEYKVFDGVEHELNKIL